MFKNMEDKILGCVNYIKNISKQKVTESYLAMFLLRKRRLWARMNQTSQKWKIQSLIRQMPQLTTHRKMKIWMVC